MEKKITLEEVATRLDSLTIIVNNLAIAMAEGFARIDARFNILEIRMDRIELTVQSIQKDVEGLQEEMRGIHKVLDRFDKRITRLEKHAGFKIKNAAAS